MAGIEVAARSDRGYVRSDQQDAVWAGPLGPRHAEALLLVVADGLGGVSGGAEASQLAVSAVVDAAAEHLGRGAPGRDPAGVLEAAFAAADVRVRRAQSGAHAEMGTTLVAALVRPDSETGDRGTLWLAHIGDSRAYLERAGRLERLTRDHSWVEEQLRAGVIAPDDPRTRSMRHIVTRTIGGPRRDEPEMARPIALHPGDLLLLSSDGLHDAIEDAAIAETIAGTRAGGAGHIADALVARALDAGGPDNVTVAVAVVGTGLPATSAAEA